MAHTGAPTADALDDYAAARRRRMVASMGRLTVPGPRGRGRLETVDQALADQARAGTRRLGVTTIPVDRVVGTVDRVDGSFDRRFRPSLAVSRDRWVRLAEASRRGATFPPIDVYEVAGRYYVRDGHHRVSVARALGQLYIDADVTSIATRAVDPPADDDHPSRRPDRPPRRRHTVHRGLERARARLRHRRRVDSA